MLMLEVRGLEKRFDGAEILSGVSFSVSKGETVAVIGPSGAGKSTMLRCLIGLERADGGDILIEGAPLARKGVYEKESKARAVCQRMGMVFQTFNLFPHMTVMENLTCAPVCAKKLSRDEARARAAATLLKVGLADKAAALPASLSGGQKQRVAIARALMMEPDILLFDEPTSALDPQLTAEVLNVMRELAREKMTMLVVTHEMGFAREASDRILFMADRRIAASGAPADIFGADADPRVKAFVSSAFHS